ncbi:SMC family ATPase [Phormidium tenue FACHB-886]|nr:SMC family ATPase [Phormidium tenue FACHB-886]
MIPLQLTLKNFLSYQEATLDFRGLHVACISGANGAGKSSLLEAIAWSLWGESRALNEDDIIHIGALETLVDFTFQCRQQIYRVLRSRHRGQVTSLEFQVQTPEGFRSLTEKGIRATQQLILQHLKLDYDTFINSAYLRQGRADEFMLKRPSDRKQILADLLKLEQYDELAEQAKEKARQFKAELTLLERNLETLAAQAQQAEGIAIETTKLQAKIEQQQQQQQRDRHHLRQLQAIQQQHQTWLQQLTLQQQQQQHLSQDCQRLQQERSATQQQLQQLERLLREGEAIAAKYAHLQHLQAEEETQSAKFQTHQKLQTQLQQLQQQQATQRNQLTQQLQQAQAQREALIQQQQEIAQTLTKADDIGTALLHLQQARARLSELDQLQMKAAPLLQRRQQVQSQLDRLSDRLVARVEELQSMRRSLEDQQQRQPTLRQAVLTLAERIEHLEKRRFYQQQVREKGIERRTFLERLQEQQRECERELAELDHKIHLLQGAGEIGSRAEGGPEGVLEGGPEGVLPENAAAVLLHPASFPPCPLCDRPLDEHHWRLVLQRHQAEHQDILNQLWVLREQLTTSDREIKILRQEYRELEKELSQYGSMLERRGQLQEQLQGVADTQTRLQQIDIEQTAVERSLQTGAYAADLSEELRLLERSLHQLNYDDKDHALARGQVDRWRWAEIKFAELRQAQQRQAQVAERLPVVEATIAELDRQLAEIATSPLQRQIQQIVQQTEELGYSLDHHTTLRQTLRQAQVWQLRYRELTQAQHSYPLVQQRLGELTELWMSRSQALQAITAQVELLQQEMQQPSDPSAAIQTLEQQLSRQRSQLDEQIAALGRLQQQQQHLAMLSQQQTAIQAQLQTVRHQLRVHQELAQAFGKNGIQALMIENILPQLEAEANHILGRLSVNQLHVQFVTQRAKRGSAQRDSSKLIDTLDILISDMRGTRSYETYSGGEAFRVNFAIRLALARLLAQRSGAALQLLIIDEGFGTQDEAGCERLIAAINAIAADFACILTVTHMPHFKEAFQTHIEVYKGDRGSQISLVS